MALLALLPILALAAILTAVLYIGFHAVHVYYHQKFPRYSYAELPYKKPAFPMGNLHEMKEIEPLFKDLRAQADPTAPLASMFLFSWQTLIVYRHDHVAAVLQSSSHRKGIWMMRKQSLAAFGRTLINLYGDEWKSSRRVIVKMFHNKALRSFSPEIEKSANQLVVQLDSDAGRRVDLFQMYRRLTFNVIGHVGFGVGFDSVGGKMPKEFDAFALLMSEYIRRGRSMAPWDIFFSLPSKMNRLHREAKRTLLDTVQRITAQRREEVAEAAARGEAYQVKGDLLDAMLHSKEITYSPEDIRDNIIGMIFAGYDTSSIALTYATYLIATHPAVEQRLVEEVDAFFAEKDSGIDFNDLAKLPYTTKVIKEALRLYPSVPYTARTLTRDLVLSGKTFQAGQFVLFPIFQIHRDPLNWEGDPSAFDPDRFTDDFKEEGRWIPFSAGARNCLGYRFAMMEITMTIAMLYRHFHFEVDPNYKLKPRRVGTWECVWETISPTPVV